MADHDAKVALIAEWLYNRIMHEREVWRPDLYDEDGRVPWAKVMDVYKESYREEAAQLLDTLEKPVGGKGTRRTPRFER